MRLPWVKRPPVVPVGPHELVLVDERLIGADSLIVLTDIRFGVSVDDPAAVPAESSIGELVERVALDALRETAARFHSTELLEQGGRLADELRWVANQTLPGRGISVGAASASVRPHEPNLLPRRTFRGVSPSG